MTNFERFSGTEWDGLLSLPLSVLNLHYPDDRTSFPTSHALGLILLSRCRSNAPQCKKAESKTTRKTGKSLLLELGQAQGIDLEAMMIQLHHTWGTLGWNTRIWKGYVNVLRQRMTTVGLNLGREILQIFLWKKGVLEKMHWSSFLGRNQSTELSHCQTYSYQDVITKWLSQTKPWENLTCQPTTDYWLTRHDSTDISDNTPGKKYTDRWQTTFW